MQRTIFFKSLLAQRLFTRFTQLQVDTIDAILDECEKQQIKDVRQIAYIFATAYHEAHNPEKPQLRMTPMPEFGGFHYLVAKKYFPFYGRGLSQITWKENYIKEGKRLGINLIEHPEFMLVVGTAANSHVYCMKNGTYTGKKLSDYINERECNFLNARRIINGMDRAGIVSAYAEKFLMALKLSM